VKERTRIINTKFRGKEVPENFEEEEEKLLIRMDDEVREIIKRRRVEPEILQI
jgi:hypothetical protein